jgi:UDP:flavonoid glycosyltransferase YjiC (YdhE family)
MRLMIATLPGAGHFFPMVPLAWAARAAGHEVLVATAAEGVGYAVRAGLPVVDTAPGVDIADIFRRQWPSAPDERTQAFARMGREIAASAGTSTPERAFELFARVSDPMADQMLRIARRWRSDVVVYPRLMGAGLLVASALGIPAVEHGVNFERQAGFASRFVSFLGPLYERNGVRLKPPHVVSVQVGPPQLMVGDGEGWSTRYVPYNAGGVLPEWLMAAPARPRVVVTLGTVMPRMNGLGSLAALLAAAADVDADFVLALGDGADLDALGPLPANVRPVGWVPLSALLAEAAAIVHHGGAGSTMTALATGVPQLLLPHAFDQFVNAGVIARHGAGILREPDAVRAADFVGLLGDGPVRSAARTGAQWVRAMPAPATLVPRLEALSIGAAGSSSAPTARLSRPRWDGIDGRGGR